MSCSKLTYLTTVDGDIEDPNESPTSLDSGAEWPGAVCVRNSSCSRSYQSSYKSQQQLMMKVSTRSLKVLEQNHLRF